MLSKKHYQKLAEIIKETESREELIKALSDYLQEDNPKFDANRFEDACLN